MNYLNFPPTIFKLSIILSILLTCSEHLKFVCPTNTESQRFLIFWRITSPLLCAGEGSFKYTPCHCKSQRRQLLSMTYASTTWRRGLCTMSIQLGTPSQGSRHDRKNNWRLCVAGGPYSSNWPYSRTNALSDSNCKAFGTLLVSNDFQVLQALLHSSIFFHNIRISISLRKLECIFVSSKK